jgi:capsule polysaccharide export protein KpsE/RkpR
LSALKSIQATESVSEPKPPAAPASASAADVAREVRRQRARRLLRQLALWVLAPTVASAIYFYGIARDQYESVTSFLVHGNSARTSLVMLGEFLQSRDALNALEQRTDFSGHYAEHGDLLFGLEQEAGSETRYKAFRRVVNVRHDAGSGMFSVRVRAFSPQAARTFAQAVVDEGRRFLTDLGGDAQSTKITQVTRPSTADESTYPRRGYGVLTTFFVSLALFVIGSLLIMAVREHAQF